MFFFHWDADFNFPHHFGGSDGFLRAIRNRVTRHPLREKEAPSASALQRNGTGRQGRKKFEQLQQLTWITDSEELGQGQRQSLLAKDRHQPSSSYLPKGALHEGLQPPSAPALQRASVNAQRFSQNPHPLRGDPVVGC
jgi:hypothetical protein